MCIRDRRNPSAQFEEVREIAAAEGGRQAGFLSRQISWLSDIGALAPMLGLLGTVVGMMKTFFEIANGDFSGGKQRIDMAGGCLLYTSATRKNCVPGAAISWP